MSNPHGKLAFALSVTCIIAVVLGMIEIGQAIVRKQQKSSSVKTIDEVYQPVHLRGPTPLSEVQVTRDHAGRPVKVKIKRRAAFGVCHLEEVRLKEVADGVVLLLDGATEVAAERACLYLQWAEGGQARGFPRRLPANLGFDEAIFEAPSPGEAPAALFAQTN